MPTVFITWIEGRSQEVKDKVAKGITKVLQEEAGAGAVSVYFDDKSRGDIFKNGVSKLEK